MNFASSESIRAAHAQLIVDAINAGSGPGKMRLYTGTRPATGGTATTLHCEMLLHDPVESGIAAGLIAFASVGDGLVLPAGTSSPTWGRFVDSDDAFVADFDVSDASALFSVYSVSDFNGLLAHFSVTDLAGLLAAISAADHALLGDLVLPSVVFSKNDYIRLGSASITAS